MSHIDLFWHYVTLKIEEISSLSTIEFIKLVASYQTAVSGKSDIDPALLNKGYSAEALQQMKKGVERSFSPVTSLGLKFTRPFGDIKSDILSYAWVLFENYERGLLPYPGSVSEQPAQIMEIFGVFNALRSEHQEKERKKLENNGRHKYQSKPRAR